MTLGVHDFDLHNSPLDRIVFRSESELRVCVPTLMVLQFDGTRVFNFLVIIIVGQMSRRTSVGGVGAIMCSGRVSVLRYSTYQVVVNYNLPDFISILSVDYHFCERVSVLSVRAPTAGPHDCCSLHTAKASKLWRLLRTLESWS